MDSQTIYWESNSCEWTEGCAQVSSVAKVGNTIITLDLIEPRDTILLRLIGGSKAERTTIQKAWDKYDYQSLPGDAIDFHEYHAGNMLARFLATLT
jgi:hypothetical protein